MRVLISSWLAAATLGSTAGFAGAESAPPPVATFSIAACDTAAGIWGVAVASKFLAVGSVVPWARAGAGAVATQAFCNTTFGPRGLDLLERGELPDQVLAALLQGDSLRERRQVGMVDPHGRAVTYTGTGCMAWAGGKTGRGYAVQGNILTGPEVVEAMARSFESSQGYLGDRMLAALEAGDAAGGDSRGRESAAIYLAAAGQGYGGYNDVLCDLRVDDHVSPLVELRRVYNLWRPGVLINEGYKLVEEGKFQEAIARGEEAARLDPDSGQPFYHLACYYSRAGDPDKAMHYLEWAVKLDPKLAKSAATDTDLTPLHPRSDYRKLIGE
jgi:uncharacterized Ntn-hydrolase superfamily protein